MKRNRIKKLSFGITLLLCALLSLISWFLWSSERSKPSEFSEEKNYSYVHFIDVGQGDCTLIETHDGKFALIDASTVDQSYKITSYLNNQGVKELEFVIFTHPHEDHIGSGEKVIQNFKVNTVYMTDKAGNTSCYDRLISAISESKKKHGTKVIQPNTGDRFYLGDIEFLILSDGRKYDDLNNSSICFTAERGKTTLLFTGDAEKVVEYELLASEFSLDAEIYKSAHHGSSTSNGKSFIDEVNPDIAVISCGIDNMYGHPHVEVLSDLYERKVSVMRTDKDGDVVIAFDEESFIKPSH